MLLRRAASVPRRGQIVSPALAAFFLIYILLIVYCRLVFYRDPTSLFFDPSVAYRREYSAVRQQQADKFIDAVAETSFLRPDNSTLPSLCVGIATVARDGERYFRASVGSLLQGLTETERQEIHLIAFIAHTDPTVHPAYSEPWLHHVADEVITYDLPPDQLERLAEMEKEKGVFREKGLYDYRYLLEACYRIGAANVLMVEDDVLALDGWYHRTVRAIEMARRQTHEKGITDYLYLRLFYTEEHLGWNVEEWPIYLIWSCAIAVLPLVVMIAARYRFKNLGRTLTNTAVIFTCGVCIPLSIGLFFAAGRVSMLPIRAGVNEMPKFGCCSQSLVFPQAKVPKLLKWYTDKRIGFADSLTEELADQDNELRWALTPSPMQHIGDKSSKSDGNQQPKKMSVAAKLWNFAFELNDPDSLRREHEEMTSHD